jgi:DUF917 family protein
MRRSGVLGAKQMPHPPSNAVGSTRRYHFMLAARAKPPVVDGDGMGRAFPELQMETFHVYSISGSPAIVADERGAIVTIETPDNFQLEWIVRGVTIRMSGHAQLIDYPMSGAEYKRTAVRGTVSIGLAIGEAVINAHVKGIHPIEAVCAATQDTIYGRGVVLFKGKVVDVDRQTREGFAVGRAVLQGLAESQGSQLVINFQNENLVAICDGQVIASVPDLICLLDSEVATAITTERLRYGQRVVAIGTPTLEIMRTEAALQVWGPKAFSYDIPFIPLERRFPDYYRRDGVSRDKEKYLS